MTDELLSPIRELAARDPQGARSVAAAIAVAASHMFFDGRTAPVDAWARCQDEVSRSGAATLADEFARGPRDARHLAAEAVAAATSKPGGPHYGGSPEGCLWCANCYFIAALHRAGGEALAAKYKQRLLNALNRGRPARTLARNLLDGLV